MMYDVTGCLRYVARLQRTWDGFFDLIFFFFSLCLFAFSSFFFCYEAVDQNSPGWLRKLYLYGIVI